MVYLVLELLMVLWKDFSLFPRILIFLGISRLGLFLASLISTKLYPKEFTNYCNNCYDLIRYVNNNHAFVDTLTKMNAIKMDAPYGLKVPRISHEAYSFIFMGVLLEILTLLFTAWLAFQTVNYDPMLALICTMISTAFVLFVKKPHQWLGPYIVRFMVATSAAFSLK